MARLKAIVVDALDPPRLARFWAAALDGYAVRAYDADEIARLAALGLKPETDPAVAVDGPGPTLFFQRTERPAPAGRLHLDIAGGPRLAEVARLEALGAAVRDVHARHTVMLDPEGNRFCVQDPGGASASACGRRSGLAEGLPAGGGHKRAHAGDGAGDRREGRRGWRPFPRRPAA